MGSACAGSPPKEPEPEPERQAIATTRTIEGPGFTSRMTVPFEWSEQPPTEGEWPGRKMFKGASAASPDLTYVAISAPIASVPEIIQIDYALIAPRLARSFAADKKCSEKELDFGAANKWPAKSRFREAYRSLFACKESDWYAVLYLTVGQSHWFLHGVFGPRASFAKVPSAVVEPFLNEFRER